ncbi:Adenine deaminase [Thermodesulfobium narugense DSM 14796]|uniref:Adenine deaminase n=1 Tax=Thermodesulfobium narugense DSM 14796 TaxID=747365 RepID=M1E5M6_9BACT|nr:adenine deaminase C-terminal domain-containing protein [Thermodesulfobium narugense]AEE13690.1 Adenine deaminase [Thermodesulfobium narugense DSM 14796]
MFDVAIYNCFIPDFKKNIFIKTSVGIRENLISYVGKENIEAKVIVEAENKVLSPGLIDGHCHIESSMLPPSVFGNLVAKSGTLYVISDNHEIANILGVKGIRLFMKDAKNSLSKIFFAIPSCVPATRFVKSGSKITAKNIKKLVEEPDVISIGEMMNVYGVINEDEPYRSILDLAKKKNILINGHFPFKDFELLKRYVSKGIADDHESESYEDLKSKIDAGMFVFIREGSAETTEDSAYKIIAQYPDKVGFCTDDKSVFDLRKTGSVIFNLRKAIKLGTDPIFALRAATYNTLNHYGLNRYSQIKEGNFANLVLFKDLKDFEIDKIIISGRIIDNFNSKKKKFSKLFFNSFRVNKDEISVPSIDDKVKSLCILVRDKSLITDLIVTNKEEFDLCEDILKLVVISRYEKNKGSACKIKGFGLKKGAIATSISHDCHNVICVGADDLSIKKTVERVFDLKGGLVYFDGEYFTQVGLPLAGILSGLDEDNLISELDKLNDAIRKNGSILSDPLGTLSFMALEVIGHVKLTVNGLFNVDKFEFI